MAVTSSALVEKWCWTETSIILEFFREFDFFFEWGAFYWFLMDLTCLCHRPWKYCRAIVFKKLFYLGIFYTQKKKITENPNCIYVGYSFCYFQIKTREFQKLKHTEAHKWSDWWPYSLLSSSGRLHHTPMRESEKGKNNLTIIMKIALTCGPYEAESHRPHLENYCSIIEHLINLHFLHMGTSLGL